MTPNVKLPNDDYFDFLLFDRHTALIHDYGSGEVGLQSGGWVTHDSDVIAMLESKVVPLRQVATRLDKFASGK